MVPSLTALFLSGLLWWSKNQIETLFKDNLTTRLETSITYSTSHINAKNNMPYFHLRQKKKTFSIRTIRGPDSFLEKKKWGRVNNFQILSAFKERDAVYLIKLKRHCLYQDSYANQPLNSEKFFSKFDPLNAAIDKKLQDAVNRMGVVIHQDNAIFICKPNKNCYGLVGMLYAHDGALQGHHLFCSP